MGNETFLFRDDSPKKNNLPLGNMALENPLWYKLLQCLEQKINQPATNETEKNPRFVREDSNRTTYYPHCTHLEYR